MHRTQFRRFIPATSFEKRRIKLEPSENQLHKSIAEYLDLALPRSIFWTTFPSGGGGLVRGKELKEKGLKAGVPDILIIASGEVYWIELKKEKKGRLSKDQNITIPRLQLAGCKIAVCRSLEDVEITLTNWGLVRSNPLIESHPNEKL